MGIKFVAMEKSHSLAEYYEDLAAGYGEIERGEFTTAAGLNIEARKW